VNETIPNPNVIIITERGSIGELRNKGLMQCNSRFVCFVDDDIILNRAWFSKCMKRLEEADDVIAVAGRTKEGYTLGCMICKTAEFKEAGGFPKLDSYVSNRLGSRMAILEDAVCDHMVPRGLAPIQHCLYFLTKYFQTESKVGFYHNPVESVRMAVGFLRKGLPDYAICELLWMAKTLFVLPFIL
jgi:glycosyltransferase involved in cell wall biosynthesis